MKAHLDCFAGISGDMYLGCLVDAGLDLGDLRDFFQPLEIPDLRLEASQVNSQGIEATKLEVHVQEVHSHGGHTHHHGRNLQQIHDFLDSKRLDNGLLERAKRVFKTIAEAESEVHGKPIEDLHFHEVGQWDAIVDVLGVLWGVSKLGIDEVFCSSVNVGGGFVEFSHGKYPVPAPATAHILEAGAIPFYVTPEIGELLTPTGAALLRETVREFRTPGTIITQKVCYGAGSRKLQNMPNVARMFLFEAPCESSEQIVVIETNIDDMNPELYGHLFDVLFARGALDVYCTPIIMKKGRPGTLLSVLSPRGRDCELVKTILQETTTFGVRWNVVNREVLNREIREVQTRFGAVKVKFGCGLARKQAPEYLDCLQAAKQHEVPVLEVYLAAQKACEDL